MRGADRKWTNNLTLAPNGARVSHAARRGRYSERRKFSRSCFSRSSRRLNLSITALASDGPNLELPSLRCSRIASRRSSVRPSWRKKTRWPSPHSGAVRNSSPRASPGGCRRRARAPWREAPGRRTGSRSGRPGPRRWYCRGLQRRRVTEGAAHVHELLRPRPIEEAPPGLVVDGAGGARKRWKLAKLSIALIVPTFCDAVVRHRRELAARILARARSGTPGW